MNHRHIAMLVAAAGLAGLVGVLSAVSLGGGGADDGFEPAPANGPVSASGVSMNAPASDSSQAPGASSTTTGPASAALDPDTMEGATELVPEIEIVMGDEDEYDEELDPYVDPAEQARVKDGERASVNRLIKDAKRGRTEDGQAPRLIRIFRSGDDAGLSAADREAISMSIMDVDGSGTVDVGDLETIQELVGGKAPGAADVNRDGVCDAKDAADWLHWRDLHERYAAEAAKAAPEPAPEVDQPINGEDQDDEDDED